MYITNESIFIYVILLCKKKIQFKIQLSFKFNQLLKKSSFIVSTK